MMYQGGGVTEKTDKQANKLVEKRRKIRKRRKKIESREKEGKKVILKDLRKKRLNKREEKVQDKIDSNPTAQKWREDGKRKMIKKETPSILDRIRNMRPDKEGNATEGKKMKRRISKGKKVRRVSKAQKMYKTGGFNTGAGSWIESSSVASID